MGGTLDNAAFEQWQKTLAQQQKATQQDIQPWRPQHPCPSCGQCPTCGQRRWFQRPEYWYYQSGGSY